MTEGNREALEILEGLKRHAARLEVRKEELSKELAEVDRSLHLTYAKVNGYANRFSPSAVLPNEILTMIFTEGQKLDANLGRWGNRPFEMLVSQVSQHWREVVINAPSLWTSIRLGTPFGYETQSVELLDVYLQRSQPYSIRISFRVYHDIHHPGHDVIDSSLRKLVPHINRWAEVSIDADYCDRLARILSPLHHHLAPCLKTLNLSWKGAVYSYIEDPRSISLTNAPHLSSITLSKLPLEVFTTPSTSVTSLKFIDYDGPPQPYIYFLRVLSPSIRELYLQWDVVDLAGREFLPPMEAPSLLRLDLVGPYTQSPQGYIYQFFSLLSAPSLQFLKASRFCFKDVHGFWQAVEAHYDPPKYRAMRQLEFRVFEPGRLELSKGEWGVEFIRALPSIVRLSFTQKVVDYSVVCSFTPPEERLEATVHWPQLEKLVICSSQSRIADSFLASLIDYSQPSSKLYVNKEAFDDISDRGFWSNECCPPM